MSVGAAVSGALVAGFVLMPLPAILWPRRAGYRYLRYHLSRKGIRATQIPRECLHEFVNDALQYSRAVAVPASRPGRFEPCLPDFEFERMLRIHSFVVHALLSGRTAADMHGKAPMRELIRSEMLRAGINSSEDAAASQRIEHEVRTGRSWDRHRAILSRYDLPQPAARTPVGQVTP